MDIIKILKEHFEENLTEEVEDKIKTAFEFAISEKVEAKKDEIRKELEEEVKTEVDSGLNDLVEKLDLYIEKANEEFIDENLKSMEVGAKVELAENIISGVMTTLKENNMEVVADDKQLVNTLETENKRLEKSLNEAIESLDEKRKQELEYEKAITMITMSESLTDTEKEKLNGMVESINVVDIDDFKSKIHTAITLIKESDDDLKSDDDVIDENFTPPKDENKELSEFAPKWY